MRSERTTERPMNKRKPVKMAALAGLAVALLVPVAGTLPAATADTRPLAGTSVSGSKLTEGDLLRRSTLPISSLTVIRNETNPYDDEKYPPSEGRTFTLKKIKYEISSIEQYEKITEKSSDLENSTDVEKTWTGVMGSEGKIVFPNLYPGVYVLEEEIPDGYTKENYLPSGKQVIVLPLWVDGDWSYGAVIHPKPATIPPKESVIVPPPIPVPIPSPSPTPVETPPEVVKAPPPPGSPPRIPLLNLPMTGANVLWLSAGAISMLLLGIVLISSSRRRKHSG